MSAEFELREASKRLARVTLSSRLITLACVVTVCVTVAYVVNALVGAQEACL